MKLNYWFALVADIVYAILAGLWVASHRSPDWASLSVCLVVFVVRRLGSKVEVFHSEWRNRPGAQP